MGTLQASVVLTWARAKLVDAATGWPGTELLDDLNFVIARTVAANPTDFTVDGPMTLAAGTRQQVAAGETQILDIYATASGGVVMQMQRSKRDHSNRRWHAAEPTAEILHWYRDDSDPTRYFVDPPAIAGAEVLGLRAAVPPRLTAETQIIPLPDSRQSALGCGVMALALSKTTRRGDYARASYFEQMWAADVGANLQQQRLLAPLPAVEAPASDRTPQ